jgi:hypothetical protein
MSFKYSIYCQLKCRWFNFNPHWSNATPNPQLQKRFMKLKKLWHDVKYIPYSTQRNVKLLFPISYHRPYDREHLMVLQNTLHTCQQTNIYGCQESIVVEFLVVIWTTFSIIFCNCVCKLKFVYVECYLLYKVLATTCTCFCKEITEMLTALIVKFN